MLKWILLAAVVTLDFATPAVAHPDMNDVNSNSAMIVMSADVAVVPVEAAVPADNADISNTAEADDSDVSASGTSADGIDSGSHAPAAGLAHGVPGH